jgi:hypothetical protein
MGLLFHDDIKEGDIFHPFEIIGSRLHISLRFVDYHRTERGEIENWDAANPNLRFEVVRWTDEPALDAIILKHVTELNATIELYRPNGSVDMTAFHGKLEYDNITLLYDFLFALITQVDPTTVVMATYDPNDNEFAATTIRYKVRETFMGHTSSVEKIPRVVMAGLRYGAAFKFADISYFPLIRPTEERDAKRWTLGPSKEGVLYALEQDRWLRSFDLALEFHQVTVPENNAMDVDSISLGGSEEDEEDAALLEEENPDDDDISEIDALDAPLLITSAVYSHH